MDPATRHLIMVLHTGPRKYALALTGGGTQAAALLLNVPGGSRNILEVVVPYHQHVLAEYLGYAPDNYCSTETALALAERAHARAAWLAPREAILGVACTATLATDRPKRGEHRFHVATYAEERAAVYSLTLSKGARDREGEESVVDTVLLNALAEAQGIPDRLALTLLPDESLQVNSTPAFGSLAALLRGDVTVIHATADGQICQVGPCPRLLVPGSFNPLHAGHWGMAEAATLRLGQPVAFEMSVINVDKPPLCADEIRHRLRQFGGRASVWLTRAPTFTEKAAHFPDTTFVVGRDTAVRIVDSRYYEGCETKMAAALERIRARGCRFLVAGRLYNTGRFANCDEIAMPAAFRDLFSAIPESEFRFDVSSTQLRQVLSS